MLPAPVLRREGAPHVCFTALIAQVSKTISQRFIIYERTRIYACCAMHHLKTLPLLASALHTLAYQIGHRPSRGTRRSNPCPAAHDNFRVIRQRFLQIGDGREINLRRLGAAPPFPRLAPPPRPWSPRGPRGRHAPRASTRCRWPLGTRAPAQPRRRRAMSEAQLRNQKLPSISYEREFKFG